MLLELALIVVGIALLVKGSDILVDSASEIALASGISVGVVGLSVVAIGTSLPELVIGVDSSLQGYGGVALGNVIGANIANICLIIGFCAIIRSVIIPEKPFKEDIPVTIGAVFLLLVLSLDGVLSRSDGLVLIMGTILYFYWLYKRSKKEGALNDGIEREKIKSIKFVILAMGIVMTMLGGKLTVDSAVEVAGYLGIKPYLIAITVISIGTTLPELTTGIVASLKNKGDLALGNSLGSICVNTLLIMGICSIISPIYVLNIIDILVALLSITLLIPLVLRGNVLSKWEGTFLVIFYVIYIGYKFALSPIIT